MTKNSWFKKPVNIIITVGAGFLAVVVIGLIIWGVTHHTEGGLLCVRWHNGQAVYLEPSECESGVQGAEVLEWPPEEVPFTVIIFSADGEDIGEGSQANRVVAQIIREVNMQVRCQLVERVFQEPPSGADIWFHWGAAYESGSEALGNHVPEYTEHRGAGAPVSAHVTVRSGLSDRAAFLAGFHGLLHGIGLGHDDDYPGSIMYPLMIDDTNLDQMRLVFITDHDVALLSRLYCRR